MTKHEYDDEQDDYQREQKRLAGKIQQIADGQINPPVSTAGLHRAFI
jgi:hypothetical protein